MSSLRWRVPDGQRFAFEDFDDGIVMFDARVGSTHLLSVTAAEMLSVIETSPGSTTPALYRTLLARLGADEQALSYPAVIELLWHLENLHLVTAEA